MNGSGMENPEGSNKCALTSVLQYTRHVRLLVRKAMEVADATKEPEKVLSEEGRMLLEKLSRSGNSTHGNVRDARSRAQTRPRNRQGSICVHRRASVANIHPCASFLSRSCAPEDPRAIRRQRSRTGVALLLLLPQIYLADNLL